MEGWRLRQGRPRCHLRPALTGLANGILRMPAACTRVARNDLEGPRQSAGRTPQDGERIAASAWLAAPEEARRRLLKWAVLGVAAAAAYFFIPWGTISITSLTSLWSAGKPLEAPAPRPIPVVAVAAHVGDMNVNLNGLGSVTALYTVTLKSRVDGELIKVGFTEGQVVKKGDLLAEIDPRPYEVMKKQLQGQLLKDEAAMKIAQLNLDRYTALLPNRTVTQQQVDEQVALVKQCEGAIEADTASIKNIDLQLQYCQIVAPRFLARSACVWSTREIW